MKILSAFINILFLLLLHVPVHAEVSREVTGDGTCEPVVTLTSLPALATAAHAVLETLPPGLTPPVVGNDGVWDEATRTIRWGPFADNAPRSLSYMVQGADITFTLSGTASEDGVSTPVTGETLITPRCYEPPALVATPVITVAPGGPPFIVSIASATPGAAIFFTLDGSQPDAAASPYSGPIELARPSTIRAVAVKESMLPSDIASLTIQPLPPLTHLTRAIAFNETCEPQVTLQVTPVAGVQTQAIEETLPTGLMPIAVSHGGVWDEVHNRISWGPFLDGEERILTYGLVGLVGSYQLLGQASFDGRGHFVDGAASITIKGSCEQVATPVFTPPSGTKAPVAVSLACATAGAEIRYTTDGSEPTSASALYTAPLAISESTIIKAKAFKAGMYFSKSSEAFYPLPFIPGTVSRTVDNGGDCSATVTLRAVPGQTVLAYAVAENIPAGLSPAAVSDGGAWVPADRTLRWGPFADGAPRTFSFTLTGTRGTHTLTGIGSFDGMTESSAGDYLVTFDCPVDLPQVAFPLVLPPSGTAIPVQPVLVTSATAGAAFRYTTDGSEPDTDDLLWDPANPPGFDEATTFRVRAFKEGMLPSEVASVQYPAPVPTFPAIATSTVTGDSCSPVVRLTLASGTVGRAYAVAEKLPLGIEPVDITGSGVWDEDVRVIRWGPFSGSTGRVLSYRVAGAAGVYKTERTVSLDGVNKIFAEGASITVQCAAPAGLSAAAAPTFSPADGTMAPVVVTLASATQGALVRYTLDGSDPTEGDALFTGSIVLEHGGTIRARSFASGFAPSASVSATFAPPKVAGAAVLSRTIAENDTCQAQVSITVEPDPAVASYAVEEKPPFGWQPAAINQAGVWRAADRTILWGPFTDNYSRTFTYTLAPSLAGVTTGNLTGVVSVDGRTSTLTGDVAVRTSCGPPADLTALAGDGVVYLSWTPTPAAAGYKVHYGTQAGVYTTTVDAGKLSSLFPLEGLANGTAYYVTVTAYDRNGLASPVSGWVKVTPVAGGGWLGALTLDRQYLNSLSGRIVVSLVDRDRNRDRAVSETVVVQAKSGADSTGINVTLKETGPDTGVFTSTANGLDLGFSGTTSNAAQALLKAVEGNTITVSYSDPLPAVTRTATAVVDLTPPVTNLAASGTLVKKDTRDYAPKEFTYTLTATDSGSGVGLVEYSIDGAAFVAYDAPFTLATEGERVITFRAKDRAGNQETTRERRMTMDNTRPAPPTALTGAQANFQTSLAWSAPADGDVAGYNVYRNGVKVNTTLITSRAYAEAAQSGKTLLFTVTAVDLVGHESDFSAPFTLTTVSQAPVITAPAAGAKVVEPDVTVRGNTEMGAKVTVLVNGVVKGEAVALASGGFSVSGVMLTEGENIITAVSVNSYGVASPVSQPVTVFLDNRPVAPQGLAATPGDTVIGLTWNLNHESDIQGYNLYRDGVRLNEGLLPGTSYTDTRLTNSRQYRYEVTAVDTNGSEGARGEAVAVAPVAGPEW